MNQLVRPVYRAALWAMVVIVVAGAFATIPLAQGASPSYTLTGYVHQPSGAPVPNGVPVDLVSRATGSVYTTTTSGGGGQFTFTSASTSGALAPGYWGLSVPPQGNVSLPTCSPCAVLPASQNPMFAFYNASVLTTTNYPPVDISGVSVLYYNATLSGVVHQGSNLASPGTQVRLIDPLYNGLVLYTNTTNRTTAAFGLKAPFGTYVVQAIAPGPLPQATNATRVTISSPSPPAVNPVIRNYLVSGTMRTGTGGLVQTSGNATVFDGTNGYIYSTATAPGGYYALGTYPANFTTGGTQSFEAILSASGYSTSAYSFTASPSSPSYSRNVNLPALLPGQTGYYNTTLDFSGINVATGNGSLNVTTVASLGNDTVFANLPNATVGQMWAQLGLDFAHSLSFPQASLSQFYAWENSTGPFFPAVQAGTAVNGTTFVAPNAPASLSSESSDCTGTCGLGSTASIDLTWSQAYALNGTLFHNSSTYTVSFNFRHPTTGGDVYNYSVVLPSDYILKAGTAAPANTRLVAAGSAGTWNKFVLESLYSPAATGTFSFELTKTTSVLVPIVNASVSNFAFSGHNVLNETSGNYTVVVGANQNVSFTAAHSIYPTGTNGTLFVWAFGDGGTQTTTNGSGYHTYANVTASAPEAGTLTVTSSGGYVNSTAFYVWVGVGPATAGIATNASAQETRTAGGTSYLYVNWSTILKFNATQSSAVIAPGGPTANISVASFQLSAWNGFSTTIANFSVAQGSSYLAFSNVSYQFLGAGSYLSSGLVNGSSVPFHGWQYNLTLTVWSTTGARASQTVTVLVNDTEKPTSAFTLLDANYQVISGKGVVAGANLSALVRLNGANASDPHNGSISHYYWHVYNTANTTLHWGYNVSSVSPYPTVWLPAQSNAYSVNLTVTDANGNLGWTTQSISVSANSTTTPVMYARNLTGPTKLNEGTSYTFWVNVTTLAASGSSAVARNINVSFYLTSTGGTSKNFIAGSPASVKFYNYTSAGIVNSLITTGTLSTLSYNQTVRAEITWNPGITGNYVLYANITAQNMFVANPVTTSTASMSIAISPNPTTQLLEYVAIGVAVVVVIGLIVFYYRRRSRGGGTRPSRSTGRAGLERGSRRDRDDEDDED